MNSKAKNFKSTLSMEARKQWGKEVLKGPLTMYVGMEYKGNYGVDVDNSQKLILDSLIGIVYDDDVQVTELHVKKKEGCKENKIKIGIKEND